MLRYLQVQKDKPIQILPAGEDLIRGACVVKDYERGVVNNASGHSCFIVDNAPNYDGINAVIAPTDADFENIAQDALCLLVPAREGDRYATTEVDIQGGIDVGTPLVADDGMFVPASNGDTYEWVYGGTYNDPTGLNMYVVERVEVATIPGE